MNTKQIEALKLALEALEYWQVRDKHSRVTSIAITAIREALADSALERMAENARELGLDYEPIVEQVEDFVGMGHKAWDMVDPKELAKGFHEALAEPAVPFGDMFPGWDWDKTPQAFQDWWNADYDPTGNPFRQNSHAYWAWAGWKAATEQPAIKQDLTPEQPAQQQEPVAWRNAALRVGEDLCSVGPFGYYDMTAEQWLDWALSVVTVHAPPASKPWVGLTDEAVWSLYKNLWMFHPAEEPRLAGDILKFARAIEAAHGIGEKPDAA